MARLPRFNLPIIRHECWATGDLSNKLKRKPEDEHSLMLEGVIGNHI